MVIVISLNERIEQIYNEDEIFDERLRGTYLEIEDIHNRTQTTQNPNSSLDAE